VNRYAKGGSSKNNPIQNIIIILIDIHQSIHIFLRVKKQLNVQLQEKPFNIIYIGICICLVIWIIGKSSNNIT